jgi:uncharacterized membrane protein YkvA (DUF1232 family)
MNHFPNLALVVPVACAVFIAFGLAVALAWRLSRRPPYKTFMSLRTKSKIQFLKALAIDRRIPWVAKLVPLLLVPYLAMPFDLIPDFLPVLGYLDDVVLIIVALALFIRLCPSQVVQELLEECSIDSRVSEILK